MVSSLFNVPLMAPQDQWGNWTALSPLALSVSVSTTVGTLLVFSIVLVLYLGRHSWKMAAAVMGGNIGGGVEMDTKSFIEVETPAGTEIDTNSVIEAETLPGNEMDKKFLIEAETLASVQMDTKCASTYFGFEGGSLPAVAVIVVVLATTFPKKLEHLAQSGEAMAMILMQSYFTVVGARANIWTVICKTPSIFMFSLLQVGIHLALILGLGKLFRFNLKMLLIASNANVGGPTTVCGMAIAKEWTSMVAPGILVGFFGCAISTSLVTLFGDFLQFL